MKKIIFLTIVIMLSIVTSKAQDFVVDGIGYQIISGTNVRAHSAVNYAGALTIPATVVNGATTYTVLEVRNYFMEKTTSASMTSVIVSEGIQTIGIGADGSFNCDNTAHWADNVTTLSLPSTLTNTTFSDFTFQKYPVLTSFTIRCATPPTVGANTFYDVPMASLTIYVPQGKLAAYSDAGWNSTTLPGVTMAEYIIATVSDAPTSISAVAGETQATVSFTAPANDGGSAITSYTVTSSPGNFTASASSSPITVTGLTNGTAYTFTVVATNSVGNSVASAVSNSVTPVPNTVPDAPTAVSAIAGNAQASVSFTAPTYNGGAAITSYTVTSSPGGFTQSGAASPLTVSGLTNGTAYTFTVVATNSVGNSVASTASSSVTPTSGEAPVNIINGSAITASSSTQSGSLSYLIDGTTLDDTNTSRWRGAAPCNIDIDFGSSKTIASAVIYTGYYNGTYFDSQVAEFSLQSWDGSAFVNIPGASITGNTNSQVTFSFTTLSTQKVRLVTPSTSDGNARYMEIEVYTPDTRPAATVPGIATITTVTAGDSHAVVSFSAPGDGGSPITSYTVSSQPGNISKTTSSSPIYITGLTNGTAYTFTVTATNAVGTGSASAASAAVIPLSQRVVASNAIQLISVCQTTKTDLHMASSVDSMKYVSGTEEIVIYKKTGLTFSYDRTAIDSIVLVDGSSWSDSLNVAYDVTRYGLVGDGTTNNRTNLVNAINTANSVGANLYFPIGTYYVNGGINGQNVKFIGQSKSNTILKESSYTNDHNLSGAENITFQDFFITDYGTSLTRTFKNCIFNTASTASTSYISVYAGVYKNGATQQFIDCDFNFSHIWIPLLIRKYNSVLVQNCYFNGSATHNIRLQEPYIANAQVQILNNTIFGGITGIFLTSSKAMPLVGGLIQGNKLYVQDEESIAMDGFGNDAGMIPVIANGPIASASNDVNGRLVVSLNSMLNSDSTVTTVSSRTDWTNFYFAFGAGTGLDGKYVKVYDYNGTDNTITVDTIISSSNLVLSGDCGIESGFFNWNIIGNSVSGTLGTNNIYGTAISIYLNVFGMNVQDNVITNCAHGVNVAGGNMINSTRTLAYNNLVKNNTFTDCDRYGDGGPTEELGAIRFLSYFSATGPLQFDNKFIDNTVNGGRMLVERQRNFIETGNIYNNVTRLTIDVQ